MPMMKADIGTLVSKLMWRAIYIWVGQVSFSAYRC